jgi:hypothetical protein
MQKFIGYIESNPYKITAKNVGDAIKKMKNIYHEEFPDNKMKMKKMRLISIK